MVVDNKSFKDRIDIVNSELNSKLDTFMVATSAQFANMANGNRDKGILRTPKVGGSRDLGMRNQKQYDRSFKNLFSVGNPKVEVPVFKGEQSREWTKKAQKYFQLYHIPMD